jgi:hypothetical protein
MAFKKQIRIFFSNRKTGIEKKTGEVISKKLKRQRAHLK